MEGKGCLFFILFLVAIFFIGKSCEKDERDVKYENGELSSTFQIDNSQTISSNNDIEQPQKSEQERLQDNGWVVESLSNGNLSNCYNYVAEYGEIDNYLLVRVGNNTNVVVKILDYSTDRCVRYVYINQSSSYRIERIPEGRYYLKIAYGFDWMSINKDGYCTGKFTRNALYEKGEDILNYNLIRERDGYSIPSYEISLNVISSGSSNSFNSSNITEQEFNR